MLKLIGLLVIILLAAAGGWYLKDRLDGDAVPATADAGWQEITKEGATRANTRISGLARGTREYVAVSAGDFAAHMFLTQARQLPPSAHDVRAMVEGDQFVLRATVKPAEMGDLGILGPVAKLLRETEELRIGGTFHVARAGEAEFRVTDLRLRDFKVPSPIIPRIIRQLNTGTRPAGIAENAIPVVVPKDVADIRIAGGEVLVYRRQK